MEDIIRHHAAASPTAALPLSVVSSTLIFPFLRTPVTSEVPSDNHGWFRGFEVNIRILLLPSAHTFPTLHSHF